ncbi:MAG: Holliday junction branch migration protein RuvA [Acidimicrobiaceae bacterium]|nr:Holliday junction branch migration protein RuvA [Acidimicrobiaceae bacterium]MCY4280152.1 Holliday junction branch migration protein RuvA [Acidimicrobiaceae bacterium]MCY4294007.1 Holliday junction branch migration protein RuvA [Acidimicrobiaceae bacterium]
MIGSLRGELLARASEAELLVEVAGVGYRVQTTTRTAAALGQPGSQVFVHVCHIVREDAQTLYGFATIDERRTFEALIGAHGVGPGLALAILSVHDPSALRWAVASEDAEMLCLVPGVGPKTAARMLVELKSRFELPEAEAPSPEPGASAQPAHDGARSDVRAALAGLGYGSVEISRVLPELPESDDAGMLLREALRRLADAAV